MTSYAHAQALQGAIRVAGVSKRFGGDKAGHQVFAGLDLDIRPGEFVSLIGASGCGKTTLLNLIAGFEFPSGGTVTVDDKPVVGPGRDRGVVFQQYAVFPWMTVRKNIEFPLRLRSAPRRTAAERKSIVDHYLGLMGLTDFADALPKTLSGGMRQRTAIARAYAAEPGILLMDEPFAALDAQTRERMQEELRRITSGHERTAVFVTHSVEEAIFLSTRVVLLGRHSRGILADVTVDLPEQRDADTRLSPYFIDLRRDLEHRLHQDVSSSRR